MKNAYIKSVSLDVTYKCNFRCLHCFNSSGEHTICKPELSDEKIIEVATQIAKIDVDNLCFCGGETSLRIDTICKAATEMRKINERMNINMVTNGYLMTPEMAHRLKEAGLSFIQISLDGATKESYEWLRNLEGAWEHAINAIKCLVAEGFQVGVAFTPTKRNVDEVEDAIALCSELGVSSFRVQPIMELGRAKGIIDLYLDRKEYFKLSNKLKLLMNKYHDRLGIEWGDPVLHIVSGRTGELRLNFFNITAYGDIGVSPYLPVTFGNVNNHSIEEYLEAGLLDVWKNYDFLRPLTDGITSANQLDVSKGKNHIPAIFTGDDYSLDLIDETNLKEKDLELTKMILEGAEE